MNSIAYIIILISSLLYATGLIALFLYKRDKIKYLAEEIDALNNILDSSDKMVNELNNLSDYVTTNIEDKTKELKILLNIADEKIKDLKLSENYKFRPSNEIPSQKSSKNTQSSTQNDFGHLLEDIGKIKKPEFDKIDPPRKPFSAVVGAYESNKVLYDDHKNSENVVDNNGVQSTSKVEPKDKSKDNVITKEAQIEKLLEEGYSTSEIAKQLGIGMGEIELIMGLKK